MSDNTNDMNPDALLDIRGLEVAFRTDDGEVKAVDGVDIVIERGSTTCIVGESGSGKSVTARSILQVVGYPGRITGGEILFRPEPDGEVIDIAKLKENGPEIRQVRGAQISLIFQEPMASLSPVHTIGNQIGEVLELHENLDKDEIRARTIEELDRVGIPSPEERLGAYTFQLSGGMRQRAMIAMALVTRPALVIADEPTTALDVTTQAQILDLLKELKESLGMTLLFITHDLGVVAEIADNVVVMRDGKVVEAGPVKEIFHQPKHDYTKKLLSSLPTRWGDDGPSMGEPESVTPETEPPLLEIKNLTKRFDTVAGKLFGRRSKQSVLAVNDVSLAIPAGKTIGLVGESGCGKTTLGRLVLRAYEPTSGEMLYRREDGEIVDLAKLRQRELLRYRHDIRMVFQDPYGSLNPRMTVQEVIGEPLTVAKVPKAEIRERVHDMLKKVGLTPDMAARYPHAFSGGQRQRISIARALITNPRLVVADEAVSALDASVRTQVLELMGELQEELDLTYLFISHDLSVVEQLCDEVAVMYFGELVEHRPTAELYANPQHDYTKALLSAVPISDPNERGTKKRIIYRRKDQAVA